MKIFIDYKTASFRKYSKKQKSKKWKRVIAKCSIGLLSVLIGLGLWKMSVEQYAYQQPSYAKISLENMIQKEQLTLEDYKVLTEQTGLHRELIKQLLERGQKEKIYRMQELLFEVPQMTCKQNTPISWEERIDILERNKYSGRIIGLEEGDILITPNSHTYGFRNGHAAIIIDAQKSLTLEAAVMGEPVSVQSVEKWETFPTVIVLRLRNASAEERKEIAEYAKKQMEHIYYGFSQDIREHLGMEELKDTHCAHMVWKCYLDFGYNLDSDGGIIVTPRDIAESPLLEVRQFYGIGDYGKRK